MLDTYMPLNLYTQGFVVHDYVQPQPSPTTFPPTPIITHHIPTNPTTTAKRPIHRDLNLRRRVALINTKDPDWPVLDASDQWVQGLGLQDKQVVGNGLMQLVTPARPKRMVCVRGVGEGGWVGGWVGQGVGEGVCVGEKV